MSLQRDYPHLDTTTVALLEQFTQGPPIALADLPLAQARALADEYLSYVGQSWTPPPCGTERLELENGARALLCHPPQAQAADAPLVVWLHGGGWVFGSAQLHLPYAQEVAMRAGRRVADVDYPLAPELQGAALVHACLEATRTLANREAEAGRGKIILGGESAGATLALLVGGLLGTGTVSRIVAVNPVLDLTGEQEHASRKKFHDLRLMQDWTELEWFISQFAGAETRRDLSPLLQLTTLPPVTLLVGEYDMLLDEARLFAHRVQSQGGLCSLHVVEGAIHNSLEFGPSTQAGDLFLGLTCKAIAPMGNRPSDLASHSPHQSEGR